jgi:molecular chaperone HscA
MKIHVVQGERESVSQCLSLGEFTLSDIPPMAMGVARVQVSFHLDADGLLTVTAQETKTGQQQSIHMKPSYGLSEDRLRDMLIESIEKGQQDMEERLLKESRLKAEQLLAHLQTALAEDGDLLSGEERKALETEMAALAQSARQPERERIQDQLDKVSALSYPLAERRMNKALKKALVNRSIKDFAS